MTTRPWDPALTSLQKVVRDWIDETLRLRPTLRRSRLEHLADALEAAHELSRRQAGADSAVTARYGELRTRVRANLRSKSGLAALAPSVATALAGVSSALLFLEPDVVRVRPEFDGLMARMAPGEGGVWVDLGCGDGASLARLADRFTRADFVGLELEDVAAPADAVRIPADPDPGRLSDVTVQRLGMTHATRVSLLYPVHRPLQGAAGRSGLAHVWQLDTALAILRPGGRGLLITEDPVAWGTAVEHLHAHALATEVAAIPAVVGRQQLLAHGVVPYTPTKRDLVHMPREPPQLSWGLAVGFRRRSG